MRTAPLPHDHAWSTSRAMVVATLALTFALCAASETPLHAQQPTAPVVTSTDSAAAPLTPAQLAEARRDGEAVAAKQGGWFWRAYAVGVVGNVFGAAIILPIAAWNEPLPPKSERLRIMPRGEAYEAAFENAYISQARKKRLRTSIAGVTLGTATIFGLFLASGPGY